MSEEPTIVLELTPQEAMLLSEMCATYSWNKGPYGELIRSLYFTLDEVYSAFEHVKLATTVTEFGALACNKIWLDDV